jgi:hypothetical protein
MMGARFDIAWQTLKEQGWQPKLPVISDTGAHQEL